MLSLHFFSHSLVIVCLLYISFLFHPFPLSSESSSGLALLFLVSFPLPQWTVSLWGRYSLPSLGPAQCTHRSHIPALEVIRLPYCLESHCIDPRFWMDPLRSFRGKPAAAATASTAGDTAPAALRVATVIVTEKKRLAWLILNFSVPCEMFHTFVLYEGMYCNLLKVYIATCCLILLKQSYITLSIGNLDKMLFMIASDRRKVNFRQVFFYWSSRAFITAYQKFLLLPFFSSFSDNF